MSVNVGGVTATLNLDVTAYQKGMSSAAEKYREFISLSEQEIGFEGSSKALAELTKMVGDLAKLEDWSVSEKIAGYESVQALYQNNMQQQMQLELQMHSLRKQQRQEELALEMERIDRMDTGNAKTTDFAGMIAAYDQLKTEAADNAKMVLELEEKMAEAANQRKNKVTDAKKEEVDLLLKENERRYQAEAVFYTDEPAYTAAHYQKQIALNRQMIDMLTGQAEELTKEQEKELAKRLEAEADYHAKIQRLAAEAAVARQAAEEAITAAVRSAGEARARVDAEYSARILQTQTEMRDSEIRLAEDYERAVKAVNERLASDEARLTAAYEKTFAARVASLTNFVGLFDSINVKNVSGEQLLGNLEGQLDAMKRFEESLESLRNKGISEDLYQQLLGLGAGRYAEVEALDSLSREQLAAYQALYDEKARLARQQAQAQLTEQRQALDADIQKLRDDAAKQLEQLATDYGEKMRQLNEKTGEALAKLNADWQAAVQEIEQSLQKEIETQEAIIAKSAAVKTGLYKAEAQDQKKVEQEKTENVRKENARQEYEVRLSQNNNVNTLRQFIPTWEAIGRDFGNMLLAGIQGTRYQIQSYLASVAAAVRAAQAGNDSNIPQYAQGTQAAARGLAVVGEQGPEIVDFSGGEQVMSFGQSLRLLSDGVGVLSQSVAAVDEYVSAAAFTAKEAEIDYNKLAKALAAALPAQAPNIVYSPVYNSPKAVSISELKMQDKVNMRRLGLSI